ncbi:hypothetical protein ABZ897_55715 [Nonomuraea sp. NPDC046802]|uniref:hypothetical protein n=1 Tax=Nonomuraea sp. NPDC046802 TaxID=3154919 RepID=UPI00340C146A
MKPTATTDHGNVLAVSRAHQITTGIGKVRADVMASKVPKSGWQRLSCGPGAKRDRLYDWALIATDITQLLGYFLGAGTAPSLPALGASNQPGAVQ